MLKKFATSVALIAMSTQIAGCASSYAGISDGVYVAGDVTPESVTANIAAQPDCRAYAQDTNPSTGRVARTEAVNGFAGGLIGGAGNTAANVLIGGASVSGPVGAGMAVGLGIYGAVASATRARDIADHNRHASRQSCLALAAQGVHALSPRDARVQAARAALEDHARAAADNQHSTRSRDHN